MNLTQKIDCAILGAMLEKTPSDYCYGWYMPIRYIADIISVDFPITRGFLHSLKMRGFVEFGRGFDDDGMLVGSGYTVTVAGEQYFKELAS